MVLGTDAFAGFQFMGFAEEEKLVPMIGDVDLGLKAAFPQISNNLFFKVGFDALLTGKSKTAPDTQWIVENFYSPTVGVKFERIPLGAVKLDIGADWLAGHLFTKNVKAAAGASMNIRYHLQNWKKLS